MAKNIRRAVQAAWGIITNSYVKGFIPGGINLYGGALKHFCVPGMNCYSCPGALGACPIGALQAALGQRERSFPSYVIGYLMTIGVLVGRFICGWLCLFGLVQELLYKIPVPKIKVPERIDRPLRCLKYLVLGVLVVGLPLIYRTEYGAGIPFFCKYLCPVGTLEAGIPQVILNSAIRPSLGWLFSWKVFILVLCIASCTVINRPFCKYICPLGAFYGLFQPISFLRIHVDNASCINCGACSRGCGMDVDPHIKPNSSECIRCGECIKLCPAHALSFEGPGRKIAIDELKGEISK